MQSVGFILLGPWVDHNSKKYLNLDQSNGQKMYFINLWHVLCTFFFVMLVSCHIWKLYLTLSTRVLMWRIEWGLNEQIWLWFWRVYSILNHCQMILSSSCFWNGALMYSSQRYCWTLNWKMQYILNVKYVSTWIDICPGLYSSTNVRKHNFGKDPPKQLLCEKYQSL